MVGKAATRGSLESSAQLFVDHGTCVIDKSKAATIGVSVSHNWNGDSLVPERDQGGDDLGAQCLNL
jgi:hypothetical protein